MADIFSMEDWLAAARFETSCAPDLILPIPSDTSSMRDEISVALP
jgi:hypothetical protein